MRNVDFACALPLICAPLHRASCMQIAFILTCKSMDCWRRCRSASSRRNEAERTELLVQLNCKAHSWAKAARTARNADDVRQLGLARIGSDRL